MAKFDFKRIYEWRRSHQLIGLGVIFFLVLILFYFWDTSDLTARYITTQNQEQEFLTNYRGVIEKQATVQNDITELSKLDKLLPIWEKKMVSRLELPDVLNSILKMGSANLLQFTLFNPGAEVKEGLYSKVPIKIEALGTYDQLANFISEVANMQRIVAIADFSVAQLGADVKDSQPGESRVSANLTFDVFLLTDKARHDKTT